MEPDFDKICFVIMPFGEEFTSVFEEIIKKAVQESELDLKCIRVDDITKGGSIIDDVIVYTAKSRFVIADLTGKSANVFYELGIRYSRKDRTILLARSSKDLPFDVKPQRTIMYKPTDSVEIDKAKTKLVRFLQEMNHDSFRGDSPVLKVLGSKLQEKRATGTPTDGAGLKERQKTLRDSAYENARKFGKIETDDEYVIDTVVMPRSPDRPIVGLAHLHEFVNRTTREFTERFNCRFNMKDARPTEDGIYTAHAFPDSHYRYYLEMKMHGLIFVRQYLGMDREADKRYRHISPHNVAACLILGLMLAVSYLEKAKFDGSVSAEANVWNISGTRYIMTEIQTNKLGSKGRWTQPLRGYVPHFIRDFLGTLFFRYGEKDRIEEKATSCYNTALKELYIDHSEGLCLDMVQEASQN